MTTLENVTTLIGGPLDGQIIYPPARAREYRQIVPESIRVARYELMRGRPDFRFSGYEKPVKVHYPHWK